MRLFLFFLLLACHTLAFSSDDAHHASEPGINKEANSQTTENKIKRIIALSPSSTEMLFDIGVGDRVVGTVEYADYPEAANSIPRIGNYAGLNIESIVALEPDLIVAWKSGNKQSDLDKLESLGLPVMYIDPKTMKAVRDDIKRLGKAVGEEALGNAAATRFDEAYRSVRQQYEDKAYVRVFYQMSYEPLRTVGSNSWVEALIRDCNGDNIFHDAAASYPVVSLESIIVKDPEVIIMSNHTNATQSRDALWQRWPNITAVKQGALVSIDSSTLLRSGPRAVEGLALLCAAIDGVRPALSN